MSLRILEEIQSRAKAANKRIALGDTSDERMLRAARTATDEGLARILLVARRDAIERSASAANVSLTNIEVCEPSSYSRMPELAALYFAMRKGKAASLEEARAELLTNELLFAAMLATVG